VGPSLIVSTLSGADRLQLIRSGRNAMPGFENTLGDDAIDSLSMLLGRLAATTTYAQQCAPCHGASGEGGIAPALVSGDLSSEDARLVISDGEGAMPAFRPTLTDDQLDGVTSFVQQLAQIQVGSELYARLCTACHGATGEGGAGPALAGSDVTADKITAVVSEGAGTMPAFGSSLTDTELEAVITFTRRLVAAVVVPQPPAATGAELYVQLCAACHGADGEGGAGPPLAALGLSDDEVSTLIAEGRGSMPGFATQLSADSVADLAEFLVANFGEQDSPTTTSLATPIFSGVEMYTDHCARCHAADGSGGLGPDVRDTDLSLNEIISRIYGGHADGMPAFEGELTGLEVQEVARFVTTLRADSDAEGSGARAWLWPVLGGVLVVAALSGLVVVGRSRGSKEVSPAASEES
jgi:mono/diheme cytochrome c family protein